MHVRVDADVLQALERQDQDQVRRLPADARQCQQLLHGARHATAVTLDQDAARLAHVPRLVAVEAHRIDQVLDLPGRQLRHRPRRARDAEQSRRCGRRHRIAGLRRQHGRDEDRERVFLALFRDFFDRRELEMVDGARKRTHDGEHCS